MSKDFSESTPTKRTHLSNSESSLSESSPSKSTSSQSGSPQSISQRTKRKPKASESSLDSEIPSPSIKELFIKRKAMLLRKSMEAAQLSESSKKDKKPSTSRHKAKNKDSTPPKASLFNRVETLFDRLLDLTSWVISWIISFFLWGLFAWLLWREIKSQKPEWIEPFLAYLSPYLHQALDFIESLF